MADLTNMLKAAAGSGGTAWELTNAEFVGTPVNFFNVFAQEPNPEGLFFKPDGTKMYITGTITDRVYEYDLGTAWNISTASYVQFFSVAAQEGLPTGVFFRDDGLRMYVIGSAGDAVYQYVLSSAWNISTAVYSQQFSVATQEIVPTGVFFKPDGTKMFIVGSNGDRVYEYSLSSAWNVSFASFVQSFSVATQETVPTDLFFRSDGEKMFIVGSNGDAVYEYTLGTAWNISTASYVQNFSVATQEAMPTGLFFKSDGTEMYVVGRETDLVFQYQLSSAWDISTAAWTPPSEYFSVLAQEISPTGLFFKPDGTKMYIIGSVGDDVNEYDLSSAWDITTASYVQNFSVSAQETNPTGLFFKPDGTKMYILGDAGNDVNEYDLGSAWDVSTASYVQNFSVSAQEADPKDLFFRADGLKMYIVGGFSPFTRKVSEYSLSSAWNISTAVYVQQFSVAAQELLPQGLFFKPDGEKMFIVGSDGADVNEYELSTPWNISTASYVQNFSVRGQQSNPTGLSFRPDGLQMYVIGTSINGVFAYDL
jgi:DNA-binding beta-propeller fold protein YncE